MINLDEATNVRTNWSHANVRSASLLRTSTRTRTYAAPASDTLQAKEAARPGRADQSAASRCRCPGRTVDRVPAPQPTAPRGRTIGGTARASHAGPARHTLEGEAGEAGLEIDLHPWRSAAAGRPPLTAGDRTWPPRAVRCRPSWPAPHVGRFCRGRRSYGRRPQGAPQFCNATPDGLQCLMIFRRARTPATVSNPQGWYSGRPAASTLAARGQVAARGNLASAAHRDNAVRAAAGRRRRGVRDVHAPVAEHQHHRLIVVGVPALMGLLDSASQRMRALSTTVSLMFASAAIVQYSGGETTAHFHFFVMIGVVALYQDWAAFELCVPHRRAAPRRHRHAVAASGVRHQAGPGGTAEVGSDPRRVHPGREHHPPTGLAGQRAAGAD